MTKPAQKTPVKNKSELDPKVIEAIIENYGFTYDGVKLVKGSLPLGVEYEGTYHYDFEMCLPTVLGDLELQCSGIDSESNPALYQVGKIAMCITSLGDIPLDVIDAAFVGALLPDNYSALYWAQEALLKKRKAASTK